jgi:hypothetical protein
MKQLLIFFLSVCVLASCNKDKFKTVPQVKIKSFGPSVVVKGNIITLSATITDKEGDLQDSVYLVRKRFTGTVPIKPDTLRLSLQSLNVPVTSEIEFTALFSYGDLKDGYIFQNLESVDRNFQVGIIVRDKAGNRSDYVESNMIVLKKL